MKYRTVDQNGDMMPIQKASQLSEGADAVALAVDARLAMLYGEWWEDRRLGFRVPRALARTVWSNKYGLLARYIAGFIARTEGVTGVANTKTTMNGREMLFSCNILTNEGPTRLEVTEDGILRAVY